MLFHELYGTYYRTVSKILCRAAENGSVSQQEILRIVSENAFSESALYIPGALRDRWSLLTGDGRSFLQNPPSCPLTLTEKRWLKALLQDPRIRLFSPSVQGLEDVEPLFTPEMFCWFDRYEDSDPFEDPGYIRIFRTLTQAIRQKRRVRLHYRSPRQERQQICTPYHLEYSEKDDKFRLLAQDDTSRLILNLSRICSCELLDPAEDLPPLPATPTRQLVLELTNYRNALERAMLHFSHYEKETVPLDQKRFRISFRYEPQEELELLIRILSFGPMLKVLEPESMRRQIKCRILKQKNTFHP